MAEAEVSSHVLVTEEKPRSFLESDVTELPVWNVLSQKMEAEAAEHTAAIARLSTLIEEAITRLNERIDSVSQGRPEETGPTASALEELRRNMARISDSQHQQEDRIRALTHKVDQMEGTQTILERDQKATFREFSNSVSDLNIKLGNRTRSLEEGLQALQEVAASLELDRANGVAPGEMGNRSHLHQPSGEAEVGLLHQAELGRKLKEVAPTLGVDVGHLVTPPSSSGLLTSLDAPPVTQQVMSESYPRGRARPLQPGLRIGTAPWHLSSSSSWSHLAPFNMPGTVSFPVANWNHPYVHSEQVEMPKGAGDRPQNWKETPTRRRISAFTSPPLSARLPPRAEISTTPPSATVATPPSGAGGPGQVPQVIRPVRLSYPWPPPSTNA